MHRPCAMCMQCHGSKARFFIGEIGPGTESGRLFPNLGPRISILSGQGAILARIGRDGFGDSLGQFVAPHGMAVDSRGDLYVGEVARRGWSLHMGPDKPVPPALRTIRKLVRIAPDDAQAV